jgi:hypothetical protein
MVSAIAACRFHFTHEYFDAITADTGTRRTTHPFRSLRLPPVRTLSPVIAEACAALSDSTHVAWEELGVRLAARAVQVDGDVEPDRTAIAPAAVARVTQTVRLIEATARQGLGARLASHAKPDSAHSTICGYSRA